MPNLTGVLETALYVDDLEVSLQFYETIFGFEIMDAGEGAYALNVADKQVLLLFKKGSFVNLAVRGHDGNGRLHLAFAIPGSELSKWETWLQQNDVFIEERRIWEKGGCSLYFRDPNQHLIELTTPGTWSIY